MRSSEFQDQSRRTLVMKTLLKTLRVCGLLMSIGCQSTPPVTTESEKVDTAQNSETQPASAPVAEPGVRHESASTTRAASPVKKRMGMASSKPASAVFEPKAPRPLTP